MTLASPNTASLPVLLPITSLGREHGWEPLRVEGTVPADLRGTLYRNGPAVFGPDTAHWFDGPGALTAVRLDAGRAESAARLAGAPTAPREGAYARPASILNRVRTLFGGGGYANLANINVLSWQQHLFALFEGAPATEVDPETLARIGPCDFGGAMPTSQAHAHRVPSLATTFSIGLRTGRKSFVDVYALPDVGPVRRLASIEVPGLGEIHDFFVTERAVVLVLPPLWGSVVDLMWTGSFERSLRWQPEQGTEVVVIPLADPEHPTRFRTEPFFWYHGANAWDEADGTIGIEWIRYPDFGVSRWLDDLHRGTVDRGPGAELWRGRIDPRAGRLDAERVFDGTVEFPWVADARVGRRHRFTWMAAHGTAARSAGWFDRIVRRDTETGDVRSIDPGPGRAVGEPILVSRGTDEQDGWVLSMIREADAAHLGIWNARTPEDGPVARLWFDGPQPHSLHGAWVPRP